MPDARQDLALRGGMAAQLVRDGRAGNSRGPRSRLRKHRSAAFAAPALRQGVPHVPTLVHCAPKVVQLAPGADERLAHEPPVARPRPTPLRSVGEQPAEAHAPAADAPTGHGDAARGGDRPHVAQAQAEAAVEPGRVLDHLDREESRDAGWASSSNAGCHGPTRSANPTMPRRELQPPREARISHEPSALPQPST